MKAKAINVSDFTVEKPVIKPDERFVKPEENTSEETKPVDQETAPEEKPEEAPTETTETQKPEEKPSEEAPSDEAAVITDDAWSKYLKDNYGVNSFDELKTKISEETKPEDSQGSLPPDVKGFLEWRESNGGSGTISEYAVATKDWSNVSDSEIINSYMKIKNKHLDSDEIDFEINRMFSFDEESDTDSDIMAKKIAKKNFVNQARDYFETAQKNFKPSRLEDSQVPEEYKKALDYYKEQQAIIEQKSKANEQIRSSFKKETEKYFSDEFKGFEFKVGENESKFYKPSNVDNLKESNLDLSNMLRKYVNEDGSIKDIANYHKAISIASNPEEFAKFFYEQGKSEGVTEVISTAKNRNTSPRAVHSQEGSKSKVRAVTVGGDNYKFKLKK